MSENKAAILTGNHNIGNLTKVAQIAYPKLKEDKVIIKSEAFALNPTDWKHALGLFPGSEPNAVAGSDVSGIVHEVGKNVKGFAPGDIVSALVSGNTPDNGAFAEYVLVDPKVLLKYPQFQIKNEPLLYGEHPSASISSYEAAAAVTLGLGTVIQSFAHNFKLKVNDPHNIGKYILIWGGATATGFLAIQVAKHSYNLNVITTGSSNHANLLKSIGADHVVDYHDKNAVQLIKNLSRSKIAYGLDTVSTKETFQELYDSTEGSVNVILDNLLNLGEDDLQIKEGRNADFRKTIVYLNDGGSHYGLSPKPSLVEDVYDFWVNELPRLVPTLQTPKLKVLEKGFGSVDEGLRLLKENRVHGEKVVFHLDNFV